MIGDRFLTDIVFGNLNGMLTVRVSPITQAHEPPTVHLVWITAPSCDTRCSIAKVIGSFWLVGPHLGRILGQEVDEGWVNGKP